MTAVTAEVVLRAPDGSCITEAREPLTEETLARYEPSEETVHEAEQALSACGFTVVQRGFAVLTITGEQEQFERTFGTRLEPEGQSFRALTPVKIPRDLSGAVADVVLPSPPELFP